MNHNIKRSVLIGLATLWLAACGSGGSGEPTPHTTQSGSSAGSPGCIDRSSAVGIEGGGLVRRVGRLDSIGSDGTLVVGCARILASDATVIIAGQPGSLSDLGVGEIVEVVGHIDPESGVLLAQSVTTRNVSAERMDGRWIGTVTIGDQQLFGDAIITVDGAVRLYVGGPYDNGGELQITRPAGGSAQFVGHLATAGSASGSATGLVMGQGCTDPQVVRFCAETANGELTFTISPVTGGAVDAHLHGTLQVTTSAGEETWRLELGDWPNYYLSAVDASPKFPYREELAEFATADDTVGTFWASSFTFQSANSGCTGNGTLVPHHDGSFAVFDVVLEIGNCNATYARFNGRFEGLASATPSDVWDYDTQLRMWLSKPAGAAPPVALTMLSAPIY
jgi:Domain of unknown function (DUF5666)